MTALQSLSDNSNSYTIPVVVSTDSLFLLQLRFSSLMLWVVIFNYSLAIWGVMFWDSSFCLSLLFNRPSMMLHEWEREASPCHYCRVRSGVQIPHGASTDTGKVGDSITSEKQWSSGCPLGFLWHQCRKEGRGEACLTTNKSWGSVGAHMVRVSLFLSVGWNLVFILGLL